MSLQAFPGFEHFTTQHCETGSLRHIYAFNGYPISEEMLLGLGAGVGFIYWQMKGTLPILGGRANVERPGSEGLEKSTGRRTGVRIETLRTGSGQKAEKALIEQLSQKQPVMLMVDMGYLPYFDFGGEEYHFGGHVVVACGYDPHSGEVLVADRDDGLHPVPLAALARARGSTYQPFPPRHAWFCFDFQDRHAPEPQDIRQAIQQATNAMLEPPITNLGVKGITKAAERVRRWPSEMDAAMLRGACFNAAIMIDARGGTGGGLFRFMYGRFLAEASQILGEPGLAEVGAKFTAIGDRWEQIAGRFNQAAQGGDAAGMLDGISPLLSAVAAEEEKAWRSLL
jgi:hypothetical protein